MNEGSKPFHGLHQAKQAQAKILHSILIFYTGLCASSSFLVPYLIYLNSFLTGTARIPRNLSGSNGIGALIMLIGVSGGGFSYFVSVLLNFNLLSNTVPSSG